MKVSVKPGAITGPSQSSPAAHRQCYRKAGSANIFRGVDLRQLQQLFHTSGDRDAERRARLVWSLCGRPELASDLWGLRIRSCKRRLKVEESHCAVSRWLHAFGHLRIDERSASRSDEEEDEEMGQAASCGGATNDEGTSETEGNSGSELLETSLWHQARTTNQGSSRTQDCYLHLILP
ncbi:arginine vasopressin-induced protein 1-like [Brienomyrus brachyistius]|uniref:arginine vasopressin-induced protein 1-like n=1 Tax=Brienomyrus brachyistius TaxID=42636 RepID=UPI0020B1E295|nr:arginine vasopressin-induced protein 1-like [Brienomyrus brachyistius]